MPITKAGIFNMALGHVGVFEDITDPDNDDSKGAKACRLFFDHVLGIVIEAMPWPFLTERVSLQDLGTPPDGWLFRYKYPTQCRRINKIVNPVTRLVAPSAPPIPYAIQNLTDAYGKSILCDEEEAVLEFNRDITDSGLFTHTFSQAVVIGLSAHVAMPLRVDAKIADRVTGMWSDWMAEAAAQSLRESGEDEMPNSQYIDSRF